MSHESQKCEASCKDGSACGAWAVTGETKCRVHLGKSVDGSSHENNGFSERHGLTSDRAKWFDRHRDDVKEWVRTLVASYIQSAPFGWRDTAKVDKLCEAARLHLNGAIATGRGRTHIRETDDDINLGLPAEIDRLIPSQPVDKDRAEEKNSTGTADD